MPTERETTVSLCNATQGLLEKPVVIEAPAGQRPPRRAPRRADSEPTVPTDTAIQQYLKANRERDAAAPAAPAVGTPAWLTTYLNH